MFEKVVAVSNSLLPVRVKGACPVKRWVIFHRCLTLDCLPNATSCTAFLLCLLRTVHLCCPKSKMLAPEVPPQQPGLCLRCRLLRRPSVHLSSIAGSVAVSFASVYRALLPIP